MITWQVESKFGDVMVVRNTQKKAIKACDRLNAESRIPNCYKVVMRDDKTCYGGCTND
jgi:hypothetical protein